MTNQIENLVAALYSQNAATANLHKNAEIDRLKSAKTNKKSVVPFGKKVYSQNEEDGLITEIFKRIGTTNKVFVELGVGDGRENNTVALLFQEWSGLWLEGSPQFVQNIRTGFANVIAAGKLKVHKLFINRDNVNSAIEEHVSGDVDLLSIDLDGNDLHILQAITAINPRVIIMEYNARFAPPISYCMNYDENHQWNGGDKFGVSLQCLDDELTERGYTLVGCNLTGSNAFFVKTTEVGTLFQKGGAEVHYEPARYYLSPFPAAHPADYATLNSLFDDSNK